MSRTESITNAFDALRGQCDPRAHDLLEALEDLLIVENSALDAVLEVVREAQTPSNVVSMIGRYSEKVPAS